MNRHSQVGHSETYYRSNRVVWQSLVTAHLWQKTGVSVFWNRAVSRYQPFEQMMVLEGRSSGG